ncbi:PE2R4-like protein [Mya arenaria]|uniref:Thromboxane A2 receptor n=1 Tax=Mya arenaria TaxID=6604 RepID=A0ABY7FQI2_MYAAR|nr:PE2R4-like protein [Mya arenaria]
MLLNATTPDSPTISSDVADDPLISLKVPAIMFATGVFGNSLAIFVLLRAPKEHRTSAFYRLVGALTATDLFGTCVTSPITLIVYANNRQWVGGTPVCNFHSFMLSFAGMSTVLMIGVMAIERFISVIMPYFYENHITKERAQVSILGVWTFASLIAFAPVIGLCKNVIQYPGSWCFFSFTCTEVKHQIIPFTFAFTGLAVVSTTIFSNIFVTVSLVLGRCMQSVRRKCTGELQMVVLLLGIIVVFTTCWGPILIRILTNQIRKQQVDLRADLYAIRLASFNQILDPWVYILFRKELLIKPMVFLKT